jgi:hypothetical protein
MATSKAPTNSVTTPLPAAETEQAVPQPQSPPQPPVHAKALAPPPQVLPVQQAVAPPQQLVDASTPANLPSSEEAQTAADPLAPQPAAPAVAEASMPLPNGTIARTIEKIGYSCKTVASIASVEGASPGVFKVTCSSGQSYRAAPVNGRYHFRKMSDR